MITQHSKSPASFFHLADNQSSFDYVAKWLLVGTCEKEVGEKIKTGGSSFSESGPPCLSGATPTIKIMAAGSTLATAVPLLR